MWQQRMDVPGRFLKRKKSKRHIAVLTIYDRLDSVSVRLICIYRCLVVALRCVGWFMTLLIWTVRKGCKTMKHLLISIRAVVKGAAAGVSWD